MEKQNPAGCLPDGFRTLVDRGQIRREDMLATSDGFFMLIRSLAAILTAAGIDTFPDREGRILPCENFFDDWFLFCVPAQEEAVYGLLKMREQEQDAASGLPADGDTPGVTVSFIAFDVHLLHTCLEQPTPENRQKLGMEINRVVAYPKQTHHGAMKDYFLRPQAEAPYLIAETYTKYIAAFSRQGILEVPEAYREIYRKGKSPRIPEFLERNNRDAGTTVCDHHLIRIRDTEHLTRQEKLAILATHTGNVSFHSFAAEVRFHARFLTNLARIPLPLAGSPYASAVRADMSIGDREFSGPTPYYDLSSKLVREQEKYHPL